MSKRYRKVGSPHVREETHPTWKTLYIGTQIVIDAKTKTKHEIEGTSDESRLEAMKEARREADIWIAEQETVKTSQADHPDDQTSGSDKAQPPDDGD
jgi:hypothetical protein